MLLTFPELAAPGVVHAITTRHGGISAPPHDALNLSWARPDDPAAVLENRRRLCQALAIALDDVVQSGQVHGTTVRAVGPSERGAGARERRTTLPAADALITNAREVYLLACFADCTPLLLLDPVRQAVGVAHAGWQGTVAHMGQAVVGALREHYGSDPADLRVVIGPSAGPCCYAVGANVLAAATAAFPDNPEVIVAHPEQPRFDLWAANRASLIRAGVRAEHITVSGQCTIHQPEQFFSHRASGGATGRFGALIGLRGLR